MGGVLIYKICNIRSGAPAADDDDDDDEGSAVQFIRQLPELFTPDCFLMCCKYSTLFLSVDVCGTLLFVFFPTNLFPLGETIQNC